MSQFDRPGRQQGDFQQEGYASQNRQQGSQEPTRRHQGGYGQEEQGGDFEWRRQQGHGDRYRDNEAPDQGNALRINGPAGRDRYPDDQGLRAYRGDPGRERAPYESNYGYESDHPSYQARGAGDWSRRSGFNQDFEQGYGGHGGSQAGQEPFDPDYHQWRRDQMKALDDDYRAFRQDRYKKFSDEFSTWRSSRSQRPGQQDGQQQGAVQGSDETRKQGKEK